MSRRNTPDDFVFYRAVCFGLPGKRDDVPTVLIKELAHLTNIHFKKKIKKLNGVRLNKQHKLMHAQHNPSGGHGWFLIFVTSSFQTTKDQAKKREYAPYGAPAEPERRSAVPVKF